MSAVNQPSNSSVFNSDPTRLLRWNSYAAGTNGGGAGGATASTATAFWTGGFINVGSYITTYPTALQTVLNYTGRGRLSGLLGPTPNATVDTIWTVTIDGKAYTITCPNQTNGYRSTVGRILRAATLAQFTGTLGDIGGVAALAEWNTRDAGKIEAVHTSTPMMLCSPAEVPESVRFERSLKVEVIISGGAASGAAGGYSGAMWNAEPLT